MEPNLIGMYITDDHIDMVAGGEKNGSVSKLKGAPLNLFRDKVKRIGFYDYDSTQEAFDDAVRWAINVVPKPLAIGIGCYGPFKTLDPADKDKPAAYGVVSENAPSRRLRRTNILTEVRSRLPKKIRNNVRLIIDTDVNLAALGEVYNSAMIDGQWAEDWTKQVIAFLKVSHGIGGGIVRATELWHGRLHPEMGQIPVQRWEDPIRDPENQERKFADRLGARGFRLEALASLPVLKERFSIHAEADYYDLLNMEDHPAWHRQAWYLAQFCFTVTSMLAPSQIVFGGRIMNADGLIDKIRVQFHQFVGEPPYPWYAEMGRGRAGIEKFIRRDSEWTEQEDGSGAYVGRPGIIGALCLAAMYSRSPAI